MPSRPRDEAFFVRVAIETHRPTCMVTQYVGRLCMFLGKEFGDYGAV